MNHSDQQAQMSQNLIGQKAVKIWAFEHAPAKYKIHLDTDQSGWVVFVPENYPIDDVAKVINFKAHQDSLNVIGGRVVYILDDLATTSITRD